MNRYQIRQEVRRILRDSDYPKREIDAAINSVIDMVNQLGRFKFHDSYQDVTLVFGTKNYTLTGFIAEAVVVYKPETSDEAILLKAPDMITPYSQGWFTENGTPSHYIMYGAEIWINPKPDASATGNTIRVYGAFEMAQLLDDLDTPTIPTPYHSTILAWGAAAQMAPTMLTYSGGTQKTISDLFELNLRGMMNREAYTPLASPNLIKDIRWKDFYKVGNVSRVRG